MDPDMQQLKDVFDKRGDRKILEHLYHHITHPA